MGRSRKEATGTGRGGCLPRPDLLALSEAPGAGDGQDVDVGPHFRREGGVGPGHQGDVLGGLVQLRMAGTLVDVHRLHAAVGAHVHRHSQTSVDLAPGRLGIVQGADALDLLAPVLHVLGVAHFLSSGADEGTAGPLGGDGEVFVDGRVHPDHGRRAVRQIVAGDARGRFDGLLFLAGFAAQAGGGVRGRTLPSLSPPPSRLAWARASALSGALAWRALTSTTSRFLSLLRFNLNSGKRKWMARSRPWKTRERARAAARTSSEPQRPRAIQDRLREGWDGRGKGAAEDIGGNLTPTGRRPRRGFPLRIQALPPALPGRYPPGWPRRRPARSSAGSRVGGRCCRPRPRTAHRAGPRWPPRCRWSGTRSRSASATPPGPRAPRSRSSCRHVGSSSGDGMAR